jgi:UPF0755 protein
MQLFVVMVAATLCVSAYLWFSFQAWMAEPLSLPEQGIHYELDSGKSLSHLTQDLAAKNILQHPRWLNWYARYYQKEKIHPGEYQLDAGLTPLSLLDKLNRGDVILHQVTLVEGWSFRQIMAALDEHAELTHLLKNKSTSERLQQLNLPISALEGWFYPDTYVFSKGTSDMEILLQAYKKMRQTLDELWATREPDLPYRSDYDALIMASIVEKETGSSSERDRIAGVFVRRLQQGMKLQTDPTVIYGMGDAYAGKIGSKDLTQATEYNTYVIPGLPPTPIASPGRAALVAALHPDKSKALYFVAKGDGTSEFSDTLSDHQRAVARYQLQRRSDYRSAPQK